MIGKKDNHDIFSQYKQVLLEQTQSPADRLASLVNKIKASSLDFDLKVDIIQALNDKNEGSKSAIGRFSDAWWDQQAGGLKNKNNLKSYYGMGDAGENTERIKNFKNMMADPSKRPSVQSNKADALENEYVSKINALQEKYKNSQKPKYDDILEDCYMETKSEMESAFYGFLDKMRNADLRQWDKMVKGATSGGLYNDLETTGSDASHGAGWGFESNAKSNMRNMIDLENTYLSGNVKRLIYLLTNCLLSKGHDPKTLTSEQETQPDKTAKDYEFNTENPFEKEIDLQGKNPYGDDSDEMNFSNINNVGKFKDFKGNFSNINNI
jgi:hypothetical protein